MESSFLKNIDLEIFPDKENLRLRFLSGQNFVNLDEAKILLVRGGEINYLTRRDYVAKFDGIFHVAENLYGSLAEASWVVENIVCTLNRQEKINIPFYYGISHVGLEKNFSRGFTYDGNWWR